MKLRNADKSLAMHLLRPGSGLVIRTHKRQIGIAVMKKQIRGKIAVFLLPVQIFLIQAFLFIVQSTELLLMKSCFT